MKTRLEVGGNRNNNRSQTVRSRNVKSEELALHVGVPQGSAHDPKLFSRYAEDVSELFDRHHLRYHLFADDMRRHCGGRPAEASLMVLRLERCIADVSAWCGSMQLQLNGDKTELFSGLVLRYTFPSTSSGEIHLSLSTTALSSQRA